LQDKVAPSGKEKQQQGEKEGKDKEKAPQADGKENDPEAAKPKK
jgi:hypothetical protein